ncbi:MAG: hypothetical protein HY787_11895 [Deltaproteobacteria bacterium]|nr:hypothetical protein [Deltaproteobacteria bacterium]
MNRLQLEHLIRAAGDIAEDDEIIVMGSMAILAQFPDVSADLLYSIEADLYPKNKPDLAQVIDGSIGELSPFHKTYGYYAHGVGPETARNLPKGWEKRLIALKNPNTRGITGWCVEIHDLVIGKYVSGREKDYEFNARAIKDGLVSEEILEKRIDDLNVATDLKNTILQKLRMEFRKGVKKPK